MGREESERERRGKREVGEGGGEAGRKKGEEEFMCIVSQFELNCIVWCCAIPFI